ncbi:DUF5060 domain-containing protein [Kriegella aquimaris]|uniref:Putative collagen-binding domain of a collagenase n=1 Tax=Kriegella aquimaris TaxID=192904 RepID=A0A1G9VFR8_9FLAO|nr:DUF5060 domain-containing protein [Kriegella aquimaris]SDM70911.1 Putative collagen-binding domain of a collagenase [Kriegella aquimaris]
MNKLTLPIVLALVIQADFLFAQSNVSIDGELKKWHPIVITFDGPEVSEIDAYNPFLGYRLNVTFRHESGESAYVVPGYFAADGNAAESSAISGNKWRVHFTPDRTGSWTYIASFRMGEDISVNLSNTAGKSVAFDGATDTIHIAATDKSGRDHRGKGILRYVGENYLRFENGEWFMKGGADAPETLLAYADFDGTYSQTKPSTHSYGDELLWGSTQHKDRRGAFPIKNYTAHIKDWNEGDPVWQGDKGKGLIGGLNYLSEKGMNAFSFLTMSAGGDGKNVWPWINHKELSRYDVSKLAQWEIIFSHADQKGLFLHFKTHETENDQLLDGGYLGSNRKLYYRELVARFGHHHALNWNLAEEHDLFQELKDTEMDIAKADAKYIHSIDPYHHPVVIHSYPNRYSEVYGPLEGFEYIEGASVQTSNMRPWNNFENVQLLVENASKAGRKWVVSLDEPGSAGLGASTDDWDDNYNQDDARAVYWGTIAAGGAGIEWYFGYREEQNDIVAEEWRSRDALYDYTRNAMDFYKGNKIPFWRMQNANKLTRSEKDFVFAAPGEVYVIYLPDGGAATLDLKDSKDTYTVHWYNPRTGGELQRGRVQKKLPVTYSRKPASVLSAVPNVKSPVAQQGRVVKVSGPSNVSLGIPPVEAEERDDWVILVKKQ